MAALLRLSNIEKTYDITRTEKQVVLKGVTAEFDRGEFVALVGESGCGKSTLINILGGLDTEYTGSVIVKDQFLRDFTERQMDDYRKKRVGMVFQDYNLIAHLNLVENVEIAMRMSDIDPKTRRQRALDLLRMVGLDRSWQKHPAQLSGGQQQRVAIARALANNPSILLADEPTGALDKRSTEIILNLLAKIVKTGKLVILVTHSELVASHCNRIVRIDDGVVASDERKAPIGKLDDYEKTIMPRPIRFADVVRLSFQNLMKKKSRSLLVAVGLAIGIAAVVLILNLGRGLTNYVREVFVDNLQSTLLTVSRRSGETFQDEDLTTIADLADVAHVYGSVVIDDATFVFGDVEGDLDALTGYYLYYYPALLHGTMPTDDTGILVNETLAMALGDGAPLAAVGAPIAITVDGVSTTYTVTGIYDDRTASADGANALVTGSALTLLADVAGTADVAYVTVGDVTAIDVVKDDLAQLGFLVVQQENDADSLLSYINLGTKVLSGVGAISMVVAAIMIFIVLYISIVERTKEIGILRAIGARKQDISAMFICEAGIIGIAGGLFAVVFTALITLATNVLTGITLSTTLIAAYVPYYLLGLALSFFVSILAGIAPAVKAAELDPVEALRFE